MMNPSTGIFTFFFTDIEGSTGLWEKYPEAMKLALARHDEILRQAIEAHAGHVFKTVGDAFCAAFASAPDALSAALDAQRQIAAENWGETVIRVRMGLHSGPAEQRDNDYFGPALNRVARLMSAGHGGQTLLSAITRELVYAHLPPGVDLRDMGEHGLKDLTRPERIYQLIVPDLPADFAPLKTIETFRTNLPVQMTSFIGREKDIVTVKSLIANHRLISLTGSGGTGKTRLSLQVAADSLDSFRDGVWFVEFASLSNPALVSQTVLTTMGLREESGRPVIETLTHYLQNKKVLLILDNCEHLIEAAAQLAESLLQGCINLRLLVSSREALGIAGERAHHVRSLSIPKTDALPSVESASQYEAINLFVDRAKIVSATFDLTPANVNAVAQICARLDGIPLAIELAAARVKLLRVDQVAERLDDRFRLLTGGSRTALPRQQTLRAMIDWSYDLLSEAERVLLRRLSVFAGGWTLEAAEQVCSAKDKEKSKKEFLHAQPSDFTQRVHPFDVLDLLAQLVNKSLVVAEADDDSAETRYHSLETVRQYAREKLSDTGEGVTVRDAHLQYFLDLSERVEPELFGPRAPEWLDRLEIELDNIRTALDWSLKQDAQSGLRVINALSEFWAEAGYSYVIRTWLPELLRKPAAQVHTKALVRALVHQANLGILTSEQTNSTLQEALDIAQELNDQSGIAFVLRCQSNLESDFVRAKSLASQSIAIYKTLGDKLGMALALLVLSTPWRNIADAERQDYLNDGLALGREIGHMSMIGSLLAQLGIYAIWRGDNVTARARFNETLAIQTQFGKSANIVSTLMFMGQLAVREGNNYDQARAYFEDSLSRAEQTNLFNSKYWARVGLGDVALRQGDIARARKLFNECQQGFKAESASPLSVIGLIYTLEKLASMAVLQGQPSAAVQVFAWADATREVFHNLRPMVEQADVDRDITTIRAHLDEATFAEAQAVGRTMSMDEAITLALESTHD